MKLNNSWDNSDYINESCNHCKKHFIRIEDIFVDVNSDQYLCGKCSEKLDVEVCECRDIL